MKFTPEMFPDAPNKISGALYTAKHAAREAQSAFNAWLKEQPVVWAEKFGEDTEAFYGWRMSRRLDDTHAAHLVGIKKIGEEE